MDTFESLDDAIAPLELAVRELQSQLDQANTRLRDMKRRRNALTPLVRLPADILFRIFHTLVVADHKPVNLDELAVRQRPQWPFGEVTTWTRALETCTHLYRFCTSTPLLWIYIDMHRNVEWIQICIHRSGSAPVVLHVDEETGSVGLGSPESREAIITALLPRTRDLRLFPDKPESASMAIRNALSEPMPGLRALSCAIEFPTQLALRAGLLGGRTSGLTRLTMMGVLLTADVPRLPALTHLELEQVYVEGDAARLHTLLAGAPALEFLALVVTDVADAGACAPLVLPALATLHLKDFLGALVPLLQFLPAPRRECGVECLLRDDELADADTEPGRLALRERALALLPRLFAHASDPADPLVGRLAEMNIHRPGGAPDQTVCYLIVTPPGAAGAHMQYTDYTPTVRGFGGVLPRLRELHVHGPWIPALFGWAADAPALLAHVEQLVIQHGAGAPGVDALTRWLRAHAAAAQAPPLLHFWQCPAYEQEYGSILALAQGWIDEKIVDHIHADCTHIFGEEYEHAAEEHTAEDAPTNEVTYTEVKGIQWDAA